MPCQSYESSWANHSSDADIKRLKQEADKLARIACRAMEALEEMGQEDFVLLKDDETREWWSAHKEADRKERERVAKKERKEQVRKEALARLSDEEKEALGLSKPKKKIANPSEVAEYYSIPVEDVEKLVGDLLKRYENDVDDDVPF